MVMLYILLFSLLKFYSISPGYALVFPVSKIRVKRSSSCTKKTVKHFMCSSDEGANKHRQTAKGLAINMFSRRSLMNSGLARLGKATGIVAVSAAFLTEAASGRLDPVNRPDLLPKDPGLNVIQTEKFLTTGQAKRLNELLAKLEKDTSFRVRVLCQAYPNTPGLAIRDYWDLGKEVRGTIFLIFVES